MGIVNNTLAGASGQGGYAIQNSLRFQSASSTYLARTPASNGNRQVFTFSYWAKRGTLSVAQEMYFVNSGSGNFAQISWNSSNQIDITSADSSVAICQLITTPVYRDPSAWYHIVFSIDTTQATASNRVKIYVNGSQVTALSTATYPSLNYNFQLNNTTSQNIGRPTTGTFDGYLAEYNFIDGQALTPSSFGETDATTGQWIAKKYTGTYGTNGFYLPFSNGTSTTTLGADSSGNSNNWTLNNFTRSAGVSDCWMIDVPSGNGGASGTQPSSNYAVMNPLKANSTVSITRGNLAVSSSSNAFPSFATMAMDETNGFYWEVTVGSVDGGIGPVLGVVDLSIRQNTLADIGSSKGVQAGANGTIVKDGTTVLTGLGTYGVNSVVMIAYKAGKVWFGVNGTWWNSGNPAAGTGNVTTTSTPIDGYTFGSNAYSAATINVNFGQRSFAYTPPTGFKALCTANLPAATIKQGNTVFDATLWTGTAAALSVTNAGGFSPDLVWIKGRNTTFSNVLYDTIRGATNYLVSNSTAAETSSAGSLTAFNSNGFSVGSDAFVNGSGALQVAWQWNAGGTTVTNTSGSISSQVRANPTAGVSVVTYTGTGVGGATIGHGLGVTPKMIIVKNRISTVDDWTVYHVSLGNTTRIRLNLTAAANANILFWNNTSPTSSVFTVGGDGGANGNGQSHVAYCFSEIAGFSKAFSYTGNGSTDGSFIYCGFRPKFVMYKRTDTSGLNWVIWDTSRDPYNVVGQYLLPNTSGAEGTSAALDILSNGFKLRTSGANDNASGGTYVGIAFAESPFASSNAR